MEPVEGKPPRKLVLHFDVNETIMVCDPAAGLDFGASLNNVIAKAAFVSKDGKTWHDGSPLDAQRSGRAPPLVTDFEKPLGCDRCFFKYRQDEAWPPSRFTDSGLPGSVYRPLYEELKEALRWKHDPDEVFAPGGHHFLLPAFFHTLLELNRQGREFSVVIRTFGTDIPEVANCLSKFAQGKHPDFPFEANRFAAVRDSSRWVLRRQDRSDPSSPILMRQYEENLGKEGLGEDLQGSDSLPYTTEICEGRIPDLLAAGPAMCIRDDYFYWKRNMYRPQAGKPLWVTLEDDSVQHIFFDDNIHNDADDSIVGVRARESAADDFRSVSGEATRRLEGILLVKAQPVEAARDPEYFLRHIRRCEENFHLRRKMVEGAGGC